MPFVAAAATTTTEKMSCVLETWDLLCNWYLMKATEKYCKAKSMLVP